MVFIYCLLLFALFGSSLESVTNSQRRTASVKQPPEVTEAYRICEQFQRILSEDLDFSAAYEATFSTDRARRRAIAIKDGEFGDVDFNGVDDSTLISGYKSRMQIVYLMLPLASPDNSEEERIFFPPEIREIFNRKGPHTAKEFASFSTQLERDASNFRAHLERLSTRYPSVAERIRKFKTDLVSGDFRPSRKSVLEPLQHYGGGDVLRNGESYYQIEGYTVVRERSQMRIAGIRFFTRLF